MLMGKEGMPLLTSGVRISQASHPDAADGALGRLQAIDVVNRRLGWTHDQPAPISTGLLATAGGLIFAGDVEPMLKAFDAPSREECTAERPRSNTPTAALVLLNDPTFVEAAREFAARILREGGATTQSRMAFAYRAALSRSPSKEEFAILQRLLDANQRRYAVDAKSAQALIATGQSPAPIDLKPVDLAAWTMVARAVLNLNETITRY